MALYENYKDYLKDEQGRFRTASLFREVYNTQVDKSKFPPLFTLRDEDHEGLISFKRIFLEHKDPTGYAPAMDLLGSWNHWLKLLNARWFRDSLKEWEEELEIKLKSEGLLKIREIASKNNSQSLQAAKYLADKGWEVKRGRPSKAEKERLAKEDAELTNAISNDLERIKDQNNTLQ